MSVIFGSGVLGVSVIFGSGVLGVSVNFGNENLGVALADTDAVSTVPGVKSSSDNSIEDDTLKGSAGVSAGSSMDEWIADCEKSCGESSRSV